MHYYLIVNEGLNNGLIQSQVKNPIIFNSLEKEVGILSIERIGRIFKKDNSNIKINTLPFGIPYKLFLFNLIGYIFIPFLAFSYALLISFLIKGNDVIIARSYFPGLVAYYLKIIKGTNYKFDPRSLFIHESITKGLITEGDFLHKKWLYWEKKIIDGAELILVVAKKQKEYYENLSTKKCDIEYIPCYSSDFQFKSLNRSDYLPFDDKEIVIAYYGSLDNGWNNIDKYYEFFKEAINHGYKICIISQNYKNLKKDIRFTSDDIFLVDTDMEKNHSDYLQLADYGVVLMPKVSDWETRLSVKFVEYLNHGLGVFVGEYVGEAVRLSKEYFYDYNTIISGNLYFKTPVKLSLEDKLKISNKSKLIFGMSNFLKIFD